MHTRVCCCSQPLAQWCASPHAPTSPVPSLMPAAWCAAGMRFIFGLNFYHMNVTLAMRQMDAILDHLPRQAILAFEVGNEVSATP